MADLSFPLFVTLWNQSQGQSTPHVHLRIATWLQNAHDAGEDRILLMAFRACGKSTLIGLFCAWCLLKNPNLRILVVSADDHLAGRMVRNVRRVIERHMVTKHLVPDRIDQWASDRFTVKRSCELRDPSMTARGITGNVTGLRADLIICDDVEVPNTADSAEKRQDLRSRLNELHYVAASGARIIYVGTPHSFDTIYTTENRLDIPGHEAHLRGYVALRIPVLDPNGKPTWPEKYPAHAIDRIKRATGSTRFQSQMMLEPVNVDTSYLDPALLRVYADDMQMVPELQHLYLGSTRLASCSAWWDPAFGAKGGDKSVLAVVYTDYTGHVWVHNVTYLTVHADAQDDEATQQAAKVAGILRHLSVPIIGLEINGIGRFLPPILRREIVKARAPTAVVEMNNRIPKNERIAQAFVAPLAARMLHVHETVTATSFIDEMRDWQPSRKNGHDDGLDAVAGAMAMEAVRLPVPSGVMPRPLWRGSVTHHAKTE